MAQYTVNNYTVENIISWIKSNEIAIPEMQRPFVWSSTKVRDLLDSLYKGYPIGYIIVWKNPDVKLKDGTISSGKKIIIDGQQRITALTAAISGADVLNSKYKKIKIKIAFNPLTEEFEVYNPAIGKDSKFIDDISEIFDPEFNSFTFAMEYAQKNDADPSRISTAITKLINVKNNNIGVTELNHNLDIETVTDIFIRINSKGTELSQADFAMSKISANDVYGGDIIRKTIDYFCHLKQRPMDIEDIMANDKEFCQLEEFRKLKWIIKSNEEIYHPSYTDVLRVAFTSQFLRGRLSDLVSLLSGRNFETRDFEEDISEASYQKLNDGVMKFINQTNFERYIMIVNSTGIIDKDLIRSKSTLNFGYALYILLKDKGIHPDIIESVVRRWLVLSLLTGRYSGSTESKFDYDIKKFNTKDPIEFLKETELGELSEAYWEHTLPAKLTTSVSSSPYFKLYLMAQVKAGDKGFLSNHITIQSLIENRGDVHHLFPKKYLQKNGLNNRGEYNQIANYAYTQSEININIKADAPNQYMAKLAKQIETKTSILGGIMEQEQLADNLKANCIPENFDQYTIENYQEFLEHRRKLMAQKIKAYYFSL